LSDPHGSPRLDQLIAGILDGLVRANRLRFVLIELGIAENRPPLAFG
jgi:hypothetical protein